MPSGGQTRWHMRPDLASPSYKAKSGKASTADIPKQGRQDRVVPWNEIARAIGMLVFCLANIDEYLLAM